MKLKDFTGAKVLDAVDFLVEKTVNYCDETEDCQVCRFRLDGVVYVAVEDPDDGYRSMMNELVIDNDAAMKNVFVGCDVICRHTEKGDYQDDDILELVDTKTEKDARVDKGLGGADDAGDGGRERHPGPVELAVVVHQHNRAADRTAHPRQFAIGHSVGGAHNPARRRRAARYRRDLPGHAEFGTDQVERHDAAPDNVALPARDPRRGDVGRVVPNIQLPTGGVQRYGRNRLGDVEPTGVVHGRYGAAAHHVKDAAALVDEAGDGVGVRARRVLGLNLDTATARRVAKLAGDAELPRAIRAAADVAVKLRHHADTGQFVDDPRRGKVAADGLVPASDDPRIPGRKRRRG